MTAPITPPPPTQASVVALLSKLGLPTSILTAVAALIVSILAYTNANPPAPPPTTTTTTSTSTTTTAPPVRSGVWPGPTNTGVPAGTVLAPSGDITVTQPGTVISGVHVTGCIDVQADNVTIRNTLVTQIGSCWGGAITLRYGAFPSGNVMIVDTEVDGNGQNTNSLIGNDGYTCIRCNLHGGGRGANMGQNVVIQDSWLHDFWCPPGSTAHEEAVLSNGGTNFQVIHNTLDADNGCTSAALAMYGDFTAITNVLVQNNLLNGGAFCAYGGSLTEKPYPTGSNIRFIGNHFGTKYIATCGQYGPIYGWAYNAGNVWSANVWDGTGLPVTP
jgi:hypothetical protein